MSKNLEKTIEQFQTDLVGLGFQKWDVDKDYEHLHIFQYQEDSFKRGLFVEVFDAKAYENRKGDMNIYLNPISKFNEYRETDHLFHILAWHVLKKAGIPQVIGSIEGKEKGELTSLANHGELYGIRMIDCDKRSLNSKSKNYTPNIIQEIEYLKNLIDVTTSKVYEIGAILFDQARNYPIQTKNN